MSGKNNSHQEIILWGFTSVVYKPNLDKYLQFPQGHIYLAANYALKIHDGRADMKVASQGH